MMVLVLGLPIYTWHLSNVDKCQCRTTDGHVKTLMDIKRRHTHTQRQGQRQRRTFTQRHSKRERERERERERDRHTRTEMGTDSVCLERDPGEDKLLG
jgi:hypothetical protein